MDGERFVLIPVKLEDLEETYRGLLEMIKYFPPIIEKINREGLGKEGASACKKDLQVAANACLSLIAIMDNLSEDVKEGKADRGKRH